MKHTSTSESGIEWVPSPGLSNVILYVLFTVSKASITPVNNPSCGFLNRAEMLWRCVKKAEKCKQPRLHKTFCIKITEKLGQCKSKGGG